MAYDVESNFDLEASVRDLAARLGPALAGVVDALGGAEQGPQRLADAVGLDKVLFSRLLKALRSADPMASVHHLPGPEPLRRLLRAAKRRQNVDPEILDPAMDAVDAFDRFLTEDVGDRSALTTLLAAWSPDVRTEFELRRKQAAWRAMSELRGATLDLELSAVLLRPSDVPDRLDITWLLGMIGLRRLRPGVSIKAQTRKLAAEDAERRPRDLDGRTLEGTDSGRLDEFCVSPPGRFIAHRTGDLLQYTLDGSAYGPKQAVDLLVAEVNEAEMAASVDRGSGRRGWVYSDAPIPARKLVMDVIVHEDVYPGAEPELLLYDTSSGGVADVNDRRRDLDRLDLAESIVTLGRGLGGVEVKEFEPYPRVLEHVFERLGWDPERFRVHRVDIDYPIVGMQAAVAFDAPER
ncbi:MAG: hypothetical protein AAGI22_02945 [Planctomycetota bacterium]